MDIAHLLNQGFVFLKECSIRENEISKICKLMRDVCTQQQTFIGLLGEMGAGKTTLTRSFCGFIDPSSRSLVSSPTFGLENCYQLQWEGLPLMVRHWDLFRGLDEDELDLMRDSTVQSGQSGREIVIVEWPNLLNNFESLFDMLILISVNHAEAPDLRHFHILTRAGHS